MESKHRITVAVEECVQFTLCHIEEGPGLSIALIYLSVMFGSGANATDI